MYFTERFIIGSVWLISFVSLWFIPKQKYRQASFIFLFTRFPVWIIGLSVVEAGWLEYPVREFHKANSTSFTFEYFVLPILCIFFNLYFPESKGIYRKLAYYAAFLAPFTLLEYFAERYTLIINYIHWEWYITFISMCILFYLIRVVYKWFFHLHKPFSL